MINSLINPLHSNGFSHTYCMGLSIVHFKGTYVQFHKFWCILSQKVANSGDPDEMQHYAAFHLGIHCLPNNRIGAPL